MPPRPPPTHFLCIPLVTGASRPQLAASIGSFKADVTSPDGFGLPEAAVRPVGTVHLTLGVMSFPKNEGLDQAVALLKTLVPRQILAGVNDNSTTTTTAAAAADPDPAPLPEAAAAAELGQAAAAQRPLLSVTLRGLRSMQPASKAAVLYSSPADNDDDGGGSSNTLLRFCERLRSAFQEAGLMAAEDRPLLLHATILNTIYVKGRRGEGEGEGKGKGKKRRGGERLTVDARAILDRYDDFVWARDVPLEKIAICRMGANKTEDGDERYEVEAEIDLA